MESAKLIGNAFIKPGELWGIDVPPEFDPEDEEAEIKAVSEHYFLVVNKLKGLQHGKTID